MSLPEIKVDTKIVVGLAIVALVVSYVVYAENRRLKKSIDSTVTKKPCGCQERNEVVIPTAEEVVTKSSTPSSAVSPTAHLEAKSNLGPHDTVII